MRQQVFYLLAIRVFYRPLLVYTQRLAEPDCINPTRAVALDPHDCAEILLWLKQVARRSSTIEYTFGRHVNTGLEHAIELPFILSRPRSPSCGLYIGARSRRSERLLMFQVVIAMELVVNRCINGIPAMAGEEFVTEQRNVFVKLSDQRQGMSRSLLLGFGGNRTTSKSKYMRRQRCFE